MTNALRTDQYTYIGRGCSMRSDLHPADNFVEIILGEYRFGDDTLRLVMDAPDTLLQLAETLREAHARLCHHLGMAAHSNAVAMSHADGMSADRPRHAL
jgi:hypothetical protein